MSTAAVRPLHCLDTVNGDRGNATDRHREAGGRRLLFVTHVGQPGGGEFKMVDLYKTIAHPCEVLLFQHGSLERLLEEQHIEFSVIPLPAAAREVRKDGGLISMLKAVPAMLSMIRGMVRKGREFDVVVCFSQKSFVVASLAKPFMRRPILWFMNDMLVPEHFSRPLIRLMVTLARICADHVVLNSQASLQSWLEAGGRKRRVSIVYPGTREDRVAAQLQDARRIAAYRKEYSPDRKPLIGMFGRISQWKGQDIFIRALAELPEVNAIMVGGALFDERDYERRIQDLAKELGMQNRLVSTGHVDDVMTLMAACDVVVHCSTAPEPFGQVIVQAMLAGTPVIASDAGGAREIVSANDTGQLTPLKDHRALAAAIHRYLGNPQWSRQVAQRAKAMAQDKFSGQAMTAGFLEALKTL